jgi:hypothetical protein
MHYADVMLGYHKRLPKLEESIESARLEATAACSVAVQARDIATEARDVSKMNGNKLDILIQAMCLPTPPRPGREKQPSLHDLVDEINDEDRTSPGGHYVIDTSQKLAVERTMNSLRVRLGEQQAQIEELREQNDGAEQARAIEAALKVKAETDKVEAEKRAEIEGKMWDRRLKWAAAIGSVAVTAVTVLAWIIHVLHL